MFQWLHKNNLKLLLTLAAQFSVCLAFGLGSHFSINSSGLCIKLNRKLASKFGFLAAAKQLLLPVLPVLVFSTVSVCVNAVFIWLTLTFECGFRYFNVGHRQQQRQQLLANSLTAGQITWLFRKNNCGPSKRMWAKQRRVCRLAKLKTTVRCKIIKSGKWRTTAAYETKANAKAKSEAVSEDVTSPAIGNLGQTGSALCSSWQYYGE